MDAVEFYKQFARYCSSPYCGKCTIVDECLTKSKSADDAEKVVGTIEKWAKDHPIKTRHSEFLKMFPNANMQGIEKTWCVAQFDKTRKCDKNSCGGSYCEKCREKFWNEEV